MTNITWAAYNNALPVKTMCPSLLYSAPADCSNLYQASNVCQNISSKLAPNNKAVISRDLQLCIRMLQLQSRNENTRDSPMGELYILFSTRYRKDINSSSLDQTYGPFAFYQTLKSQHMKRAMEAF